MTRKKNIKEIRENVLAFFSENIDICLSAFIKAEDSKLSKIYDLKQMDFTDLIKKSAILILTANKYETNILHTFISENSQKKIIKCTYQFNNISYNIYFFQWGQYYCVHIMAPSTGSNTINGSEDMVRMMFSIKEFNPLAVLSFGICFGINHTKQNLCDVIIVDKLYSYGVGIKVENSKVIISDDNNFQIKGILRNKIMELFRENILKEGDGEFLKHYITGEVVVSNEDFKQAIIQQIGIDKGIFAGEMEGYGIFKECERYGKSGDGLRSVPCLLVKSICDWGAEKNGFFVKSDKDSKNDSTNAREILYKKIKRFYNQKRAVLPQNIKTHNDIEGLIKDSIQAFAAQCAFNTCNKIVNNMVFGMKPYDYVCKVLQNLREKGDRIIEDKKLKKYITEKADYLTDMEIENIILDLIQEGKISNKNNGFYSIF